MKKYLLIGLLFASAVNAQNYEVKAVGTRYVPDVIRVGVGDTVTFVNMIGHTTKTLDEYIPTYPGLTCKSTEINKKGCGNFVKDDDLIYGWESKLGEEFTTPKLTNEGVYFVKCQPHWSMGMGVAIIVGKGTPTNLDDIEALKPKGSAKRLLHKVKKFLKKEGK